MRFPEPIDDLRRRMQPVIRQAVLNFKKRRIDALSQVSTRTLLQKENPYLFAATSDGTLSALAESFVSAFLSSSEETLIGNMLFEPIAREACQGQKADATGIDIRVERDSSLAFVAVKSGTSVFNGSSKKKQNEQFLSVHKRVSAAGHTKSLDLIVGYCYGKKGQGKKDTKWVFRELAGADFWTYLSGDPEFYAWLFLQIAERDEMYSSDYAKKRQETIQLVTAELESFFLDCAGSVIRWSSYLEYNSGPGRRPRL